MCISPQAEREELREKAGSEGELHRPFSLQAETLSMAAHQDLPLLGSLETCACQGASPRDSDLARLGFFPGHQDFRKAALVSLVGSVNGLQGGCVESGEGYRALLTPRVLPVPPSQHGHLACLDSSLALQALCTHAL